MELKNDQKKQAAGNYTKPAIEFAEVSLDGEFFGV
jgi:hypothetical protein